MATKCIFKRAKGKDPGFGSVEDIRVGDGVTYYQFNRFRTAQVEKLNIAARRLRTKGLIQGKTVLRGAVTLTFDEVLEIHRKVEDLPVGSSEAGSESPEVGGTDDVDPAQLRHDPERP